jgi:hypothetical protein
MVLVFRRLARYARLARVSALRIASSVARSYYRSRGAYKSHAVDYLDLPAAGNGCRFPSGKEDHR